MSTAPARAGGAAVAEGDRSVAIGAPTRNSVFVTGDNNTIRMELGGASGTLLAWALRWSRPRRRRRRDRLHGRPPPFENHLDRAAEVETLLAGSPPPRVVSLYGRPGAGKTYLLCHALNQREARMRHGIVYLPGRDQSADDLLHALFDEFYVTRTPRRDLRIERHLRRKRALVAFDDVDADLDREDAQRLMLGAPACRLLVASERRVMLDGTPLLLRGLAGEDAIDLAEQELGRRLDDGERRAAAAIAAALEGHPLALRQAFGRAHDEGRALDELARELPAGRRAADAATGPRLASLSPDQLRLARMLAIFGAAPVGLDHLRELVDDPDVAGTAAALERRHDAASHSPRYRLAGALGRDLPRAGDLGPELDRALTHFTRWAERHRGDPATVLEEAPALLALLQRARAAGRGEAVVRLGRAVDDAFTWGRRWAAWGRTLQLVLGAAHDTGDRVAEGWALHQLGTRAMAIGRRLEAPALLREALGLRERIGDKAGAAATRQNLRVATVRPPLLHRLSHLPIAVLAGVAALLIGGGGIAGAALIAGGDDGGDSDAPLALTVTAQGDGTVRSRPAGIRCPPDCTGRFPAPPDVTLRARPRAGWEFAGWRGAGCAGTGACRLRSGGTEEVRAVFEERERLVALTVTVAGDGRVTSRPAGVDCRRTCQGRFERGREVTLIPAAGEGHVFAGWAGDCRGSRACRLKLAEPRAVRARFRLSDDAATLTVERTGDADGRVIGRPPGIDCGATCEASVERETEIVLRAAPAQGADFGGWSGGGCHGTRPCRVRVVDDVTVRARFIPAPDQPEELSISVGLAGDGAGSVTSVPERISCPGTCTASFAEGSTVTLVAQEGRESSFAGWTGDCTGTTCELTLDEAKSVTATFDSTGARLTTRVITMSAEPGESGGSVSPDCSRPCRFERGEPVTVTATANAKLGWSFMRWEGDCAGQRQTCKLTMDRDRSATAVFGPSETVPGASP